MKKNSSLVPNSNTLYAPPEGLGPPFKKRTHPLTAAELRQMARECGKRGEEMDAVDRKNRTGIFALIDQLNAENAKAASAAK